MFGVTKTQEFYCVCCGSLKKYKGHFTCSKTCANTYLNKKNTHWRTAGLSCKFCVECGNAHHFPAVNSSPYCSGKCRATFKSNCRGLGNPEPRDRGNRGNQQGAQLVQQPRQQGNWNRANQQGAQLFFARPRQQGNWNRANQQGAQLFFAQTRQQGNWNRANQQGTQLFFAQTRQQGAQFVVVQQPQQPSLFGQFFCTKNF